MTMAKRVPDRIALLAKLGYEVKKRWRTDAANKYGAKRVGNHASKKEHYRAEELKIMERAGLISDLREQVPFTLIPAQYIECDTTPNRKPIRSCLEKSCKYIADFIYVDNATWQTVVEDTKGVRTKEYIIKRKLMLWVHGIRIREV